MRQLMLLVDVDVDVDGWWFDIRFVVPVLKEKHLNSISDNIYKIAGPPWTFLLFLLIVQT